MDVQFQLPTGRPLVSRVPPLHYDGHRSLAHRPQDFTSPDRETIQHALAIASSCRASQPAAPAGKSAPRWIDRIIGTARSPSLCDNDFNSALRPLFHNRDARYPCVGRPRRDEQLHVGFRGLFKEGRIRAGCKVTNRSSPVHPRERAQPPTVCRTAPRIAATVVGCVDRLLAGWLRCRFS